MAQRSSASLARARAFSTDKSPFVDLPDATHGFCRLALEQEDTQGSVDLAEFAEI
jgi:hypothetical protein